MAVKKQTGRRRSRNAGKFTPLIWIVTGALIALAIVYSNTIFQGHRGTSTNGGETNRLINLQTVASNIFNTSQVSTTTTTIPGATTTTAAPQGQQFSLFLAKRSGSKVKLVEARIAAPQTQGQLKSVLETLIAYRNDDYLNLIPFDTKIRKVWIQNRVAYVDFSEEFGFNSYGLIGYQIQVYQVVYTAAQFATVDAVYFYMEGEPLEYLGGEGYLLHNPVYPFSYLPEYNL